MKNVIENNTIIAEFMGAYKALPELNGHEMDKGYPDGKDRKIPENMEYHTSWDWLMTVIEKLENSGVKITIGRMYCEIEYQDLFDKNKNFGCTIVSGVKINAVNGAVVDFIKWYNENK